MCKSYYYFQFHEYESRDKSLDLLICFCFSFVDQLIVNKYVESETKRYYLESEWNTLQTVIALTSETNPEME